MRKLIFALVALGAGASIAAHYLPAKEAQAEGAQTPAIGAQVIQSVSLDGGRDLPTSELRAVLETRVGDSLDGRRLEHDRAALEDALAARGYLAARVAPASVTFGARGGAYVVFDVAAGRVFHLRSITVTGPGQKDAAVVTLAAGDEASRDRLARARQVLADTFARRGGKQVELRLSPDAAAAAVDVELATR